MKPTIVWFRKDLRLGDNPALTAAVRRGAPVVPVYILDDEAAGDWRPGGASRWWLHQSLEALAKDLAARGSQLVLRRGRARDVLDDLIRETSAEAVFWNRCYEPFAIARDKDIKQLHTDRGLDVRSFNGSLLAEPWDIKSKSDKPFRVFTPFWKTVTAELTVERPLPTPDKTLPAYGKKLPSDDLKAWGLLPTKPDWAGGLREAWVPGEAGAKKRLADFLDEALGQYEGGRDRPDRDYTSRLSPHLHWGEISPRQIWHALGAHDPHAKGVQKFQSEIGWREFSYHLLYQAPELPEKNLRPEFDDFPWADSKAHLEAWQKGETGIPMVDAGMRQLWHTGWMHNRVRMIAASYLVKHLLQPWQAGARWFWDTLVDADLANNSASWQWVAGCGADAAPYFRVFNPALQGEKFDTEGEYVRRWVPELEGVPKKYVHKPWEMASPPADYPAPIVSLAHGRARALEAFEAIKRG